MTLFTMALALSFAWPALPAGVVARRSRTVHGAGETHAYQRPLTRALDADVRREI